uniref:S2/P23 family protein n=1 Tax=Borreliella californiensis TaxID=373543 RepID=UPI003B215461
MKNSISILNIFFFISFFYSCFLVPKSLKKIDSEILGFDGNKENNKENIKDKDKDKDNDNDKNISCVNEVPRLNEIKVGEVYGGLFAGYVVWAKSGNLIAIKDRYNNLIKDLEGLKYSYIFSPIQFKRSLSWFGNSYSYVINDNKYKIFNTIVPIAKIIAFESTKEFEEKYEVKNLKLISAGSNIDFEQYRTGVAKINLKEYSIELGYVNSYNFGVFNDDLTNSFKLLYKKSGCSHMLAHITIKDKQINKDKTYEIALNLNLFADTIKLIFDKYPNLSNEKLNFPIKE